MKIVFMGTPQFAVPILEALHEKYEIVLVVSQPNRAKKKGQLIQTPIAECAMRLGLELFQPESLKTDYERIVEAQADVLVTAAYGQFVPSKVLKVFRKTLNVHGSLLPKYRGGAPIQRSIMNGDKVTGVTIIEMAKKMDSGRMYGQKECPILESDTSSSMFEKLSYLGRDLLLEVIEPVYNETNLGILQDEEKVTFAYNLTKEEEQIDFTRTAFEVARQINGLSLDPGAYFMFQEMPIKVLKASFVAIDSDAAPGTILSLKKEFLVQTGKGAVRFEQLLVPGKKLMDVKSFLNGQKIFKEHDVI